VPLEDLRPAEQLEIGQSNFQRIVDMARRDQMTIRELVRWAVGSGTGHRYFVGTPEQLADDIEFWATTGACDGVSLMPSLTEHDFPIFVDHVVPLLQERDLFRSEYESGHLRGLFGLTPVAQAIN
jgi:alkanesulfonate monooxygenase SsuD/methylene tetrahydromethanopterin reductase-like flavin-dependent oxidoreductase (luciferase family)